VRAHLPEGRSFGAVPGDAVVGVCRQGAGQRASRLGAGLPPQRIGAPIREFRRHWWQCRSRRDHVGHSERVPDHGEGVTTLVRRKAEAAWRAGGPAIVCQRRTRAQSDAERSSISRRAN